MSRLDDWYESVTPDDMPAPFYDDSDERADAHRDSLADLKCGRQVADGLRMSDAEIDAAIARMMARKMVQS